MPPKVEYWTISEKQFKDFKSRIDDLEQRLFESLNPYGFTKIESQHDWLGFTISKKHESLLTLASISLYKEAPIEFELILKQWNINNPAGTFKDLYRKSFDELDKLESNYDLEVEKIYESLINWL